MADHDQSPDITAGPARPAASDPPEALEAALHRLSRRVAAARPPRSLADRFGLHLLRDEVAALGDRLEAEREAIGRQIQAAVRHHKAATVYSATEVASKKGHKR
jgi:hypothetical protein